MKELDFDELDRAVNTLMGGMPASTQAPKPAGDEAITIPTTLPDGVVPTIPAVTPVSRTSTTASTPVAAPVSVESAATPSAEVPTPTVVQRTSSIGGRSEPSFATRRSGRFMDVVHPSSDMKNPSNDAPSTSPSRTAPTMQPITAQSPAIADTAPVDDLSDDVLSPLDQAFDAGEFAGFAIEPSTGSLDTSQVEAEPVIAPVPERKPEPVAAAPDHEWPDPLANFSVDTEPLSVEPTTEPLEIAPEIAEVAPEVVDDVFDVDMTEQSDDTTDEAAERSFERDLDQATERDEAEFEPLTSPFLTDAKVEKRPLGSGIAAQEIPADLLEFDYDDGTDPSRSDKTQSNPEDQLPADPVAQVQLPAELQSDLVAVEADTTGTSPEVEAVAEPAVEPSAPQSKPAVTGPTSIQQQYTESAETGDQTNGSIYDTDTYHQALTHPVKKKSGWIWVLWVFLLLIVGAGGAAALYYAGII